METSVLSCRQSNPPNSILCEGCEDRERFHRLVTNRHEALSVLRAELAKYRARSYDDLARLVSEINSYDVVAPSGLTYQVEIVVNWDGHKDGDIRVDGMVDDGGWRAFVPLCTGFVIDPDGTIRGS